jgi:hypothetical protein
LPECWGRHRSSSGNRTRTTPSPSKRGPQSPSPSLRLPESWGPAKVSRKELKHPGRSSHWPRPKENNCSIFIRLF